MVALHKATLLLLRGKNPWRKGRASFQSLGEAKQVWYTGLEQRESNWTHRWETGSKPGGEEVELAHGIR